MRKTLGVFDHSASLVVLVSAGGSTSTKFDLCYVIPKTEKLGIYVTPLLGTQHPGERCDPGSEPVV